MSKNNFDRIAPFYDRIANAVFGGALLDSQTAYFSILENESEVLILGGGSGNLLEGLPHVGSIDYVEKSNKMILLACQRKPNNKIVFIHQDFLDWESKKQYDYIICPFFLDCFSKKNLRKTISKVRDLLKPGGHLLVSDFEENATNSLLSWLMHFFFRICASLESRSLKSIHIEIISKRFELAEEKFFHQNMIFSRVYRNL